MCDKVYQEALQVSSPPEGRGAKGKRKASHQLEQSTDHQRPAKLKQLADGSKRPVRRKVLSDSSSDEDSDHGDNDEPSDASPAVLSDEDDVSMNEEDEDSNWG